MTGEHSKRAQSYHPDPFEIQIGALVVLHRAALLSQNATAHDALIEIANDYRWYGQLLEQQSGTKAPWDRNSKNDVAPPELFLDTADLIGHTQSIPRPSLGMDYRHFRLTPRAEAKNARFGPTPKMARSAAVVEVVQHPDKRWQVLHAEVSAGRRRQGLATMLYDSIETILGTILRPSGWLTEDAYQFWRVRGCEFLVYYRQVERLPRLWISPKTLLNLRAIAETKLTLMGGEGSRRN
jgi:hypothetical protein